MAKRLPKAASFSEFTPEKCTCGVVNNKGRIVNGENAQKFEFLWIGALVYASGGQNEWDRVTICGASLVSDSYAVTAAHCLFAGDVQLLPENFEAIFHAHVMDKRPLLTPEEISNFSKTPGWNLSQETDESESSIRTALEEIIIHPFYQLKPVVDYDIAVIKLKNKMDLGAGAKVTPICLPYLNEKLEYKEGRDRFIAAGWGRFREEWETHTRVLQKQEQPFISEENCKGNEQTKRNICAGYKIEDKGVCYGDSGGPLIFKINEGKNQHVLAGVVSTGKACAKGNPTLFTDTRETVQWIYRHIGKSANKFCPR